MSREVPITPFEEFSIGTTPYWAFSVST